jgi:ubiquinone/menaquinone biosynthesis C-methylase UbiE
VGDAAALVDPFLGEGIYYAIRSGQLAAQTMGEALEGGGDDARSYQDLVEAELYPEFRAARKMAQFLYGFPRVGYEILKRRRAFVERYFDALRGEASYEDLWRELRATAGLDLLRSLWPATANRDVGRHYDRVASRYDSRFGLWRELVAAGAWSHLERLLAESVRDGARVLDAGTGTGAAIQALLRCASPGEVVGVDISKGMLRMARRKVKDPQVRFEVQDITSLPYPDRSLDVALSAWTLETLPDPRQAVREFLRVIKDDGYVIYTFSSRPAAGLDRAYAALLERAYQGSLRWHLLGKDERPYHDCAHSSLTTFARGLATVVVLRKCCSVDAPDTPCLPGPPSGQGKG